MKKIFGMILAVCLMVTLLCVSAFADEAPASDVVLRVSALKKDGSTVIVADHNVFDDGWNAAMELAVNKEELKKNDYIRVIVDLYADWIAVDGEFTDDFWNGEGFNWDAIRFCEDVKMTLNMNGHTIDRGLTDYELNGEVIFIGENADVIINDGTIKGGYSNTGAGGIHIDDGANVTLNDVRVVGNGVRDDDGAGIALYDGATLTMNGGSVSDNVSISSSPQFLVVYGGGIYAKDSTVVLNGVTLQNNQGFRYGVHGAAVYVDNGVLSMDNCRIIDNGLKTDEKQSESAYTIVHSTGGSDVTIQNTVFSNNGGDRSTYRGSDNWSETYVIMAFNGTLVMENCDFKENEQFFLLGAGGAALSISDTDFTGNQASAFNGFGASGKSNTFTNCSFEKGSSEQDGDYTFAFTRDDSKLSFINCTFGSATFNNKNAAKFEKSSRELAGSVFSEGSLAMIVSVAALVASIASVGVSVALNKKKAVPAKANTEDKE